MPKETAANPPQTIADLRRDLAQARAERDESLARETATAEVLQVINSSPGDLAPAFDAMLEKAMTLCGAAFGALMSYDGERVSAVATRGLPPELSDVFREPIAPRREGDAPYARFLRGEPLLHIIDMAADDVLPSLASRPRALVEIGGARTGLEIPLRKEGALLGSIWLYRQEVRPFTDKQVALLQNFAAQAVIAMENARLLTETREALEQQTATAEVLQVINSSPGDLAPVFDAMLERATRVCGANFGIMNTHDGERFVPVAVRGVPAALEAVLLSAPPPPSPLNALIRLAQGEEFVRHDDLRKAPAYQAGDPRALATVDLGGARSYVAVGLRKDNHLFGTLGIYRQEVRPFTDKQIALLQNFAAQAVIAMENARLITETREALEQQTATAEVLQVINSSPGELAPVFDAMLEKAIRLCGASFGALGVWQGERFEFVAAIGTPALDFLAANPMSPPGSRAGYARVAHGEGYVQFADISASKFYEAGDPMVRAAVDFGGARTTLTVPLAKDDTVLGLLIFHRQEVRPFADREITLVQSFAAQAVIAMENARLITETREALEQQTATAEVLGVINSSPGDLTPVFEAMLDKALRVCGAAFGELHTYDGERFHTAAVRGASPAYAEARAQTPPSARPGSGSARILETKRPIQSADLMAEASYRDGDPSRRALVDIGGARSAVAVPLLKEETVLGFVMIFRIEVRPFTDKQIALLQNFAAQAVIAMDNARLITETREALEQQTATAEVLGVINSSPGNLAPVFDAMLDKAMRLCEANFGFLSTYDGERFNAVALHGLPDAYIREYLTGPYLPGPNTTHDRLVRGEAVVHVPDLTVDAADSPRRRAVVEVLGVRSILAVPLRKDDRVLGAIHVYRREVRPFSEKQIALLENFAAQAVIAMENARLITETREALDQQTATAEVLGVINSSPGDLAPVFEAMLDKAMRLCGAAFGGLWTFEGERYVAAALRGVPTAYAEFLADATLVPPGPGTAPYRFLRGERVVHNLDLAAEEPYRAGEPNRRALVDLGGARTALQVPLRKDDAVLGVITIYRQEVRPFTDKQIALLQNFAAQAVIAMENARLLGELRARTDEIAGWNKELEERVAAQLAEIERTGKLRRFLAPQLADLILAQGDDSILESHRREIVVVFCDLRGFTAFAERAEPEEVMALLKDYHTAMGPIVAHFEGTIDHYGGDGIMVFFNDPVPTPDPARRAIEMAVAMRDAAQDLLRGWRRHGHDLGFGVGISQGYATLGQIGFAERMDYTAIGTVTNLAARLCAEAKNGQILVSSRVASAIEDSAELEEIGDLALKGLSQAVAVYNVP